MKKLTLILTIPLASIVTVIVLIAIASFIKFNFLDVPYLGEQATYQTESGEEVIAHQKVDGSIEISGLYFKTFHLKPAPNASGERYSDKDESFVFGAKATQCLSNKMKRSLFVAR